MKLQSITLKCMSRRCKHKVTVSEMPRDLPLCEKCFMPMHDDPHGYLEFIRSVYDARVDDLDDSDVWHKWFPEAFKVTKK